MLPGRVLPGVAAAGLLLSLVACSAQAPDAAPGPDGPIGPVPPSAAPLSLAGLAGIVTDADAPATGVFAPGDTASTSGEDLASERDYWSAVGGRPDECADVVAAPYIVSAHDTGARLDDPSGLLATITEVDEERFGLIQVYAREFDDGGTAEGFLTEVRAAVDACPGYELIADGAVNWRTVSFDVTTLRDLPGAVSGIRYVETVRSDHAESAQTSFVQRGPVVVSVYAEITGSSTLTASDADRITLAIATRLAAR